MKQLLAIPLLAWMLAGCGNTDPEYPKYWLKFEKEWIRVYADYDNDVCAGSLWVEGFSPKVNKISIYRKYEKLRLFKCVGPEDCNPYNICEERTHP